MATFAHAISSTNPTSAISTSSGAPNICRKPLQPVPPGTTSSLAAMKRSRDGSAFGIATSTTCGHATSSRVLTSAFDKPARRRAITLRVFAPATSILASSGRICGAAPQGQRQIRDLSNGRAREPGTRDADDGDRSAVDQDPSDQSRPGPRRTGVSSTRR